LNCELVVDETIQQSEGQLIQYVSVYENAAAGMLSNIHSWPNIVDARIIAEGNDGALVELIVIDSSLVRSVVDSRAIPRHISANRGEGRIVAEVPPSTEPQQVIEVIRDRHPDSKLAARREYEGGPVLSESLFTERLFDELTDRQSESLITAFEEGYFDTPRKATADHCANALGISQSTFSQHLNVALYKILKSLLKFHEET